MNASLSARTIDNIKAIFPLEDRDQAALLLSEQCGNNLPGLGELDAIGLERYRFAALKICHGQLSKLERAVRLAQTDWRDLLVAAEFANDPKAHEIWQPKPNRS